MISERPIVSISYIALWLRFRALILGMSIIVVVRAKFDHPP
jgi:hypothetical protein